MDFKTEAEALRDELVARRRDFHKHPELGFEEIRTAGIVAQELMQLNLEVQTGVGRTGVVGMLEGGREGPTVLVRADMDALPIQEENRFEFASANPGKMHACGHDGHTAILLGVAKLLSSHRDEIAGRIKFVFQPAEEIVGGAKAMVADGVLGDPKPDVTLGLHLWNRSPLGWVGVGDGPVMAGSTTFKLVVRGKGGHGASPHLAVDPVICAAHLITAFQTIVSRNVNPLDSAVISVTKLQAGTATNIIPEEVELQGTIRTFKTEILDLVKQRMHDLSHSVAEGMGCSTRLTITDHTKPVANDAVAAERVRTALGRVWSARRALISTSGRWARKMWAFSWTAFQECISLSAQPFPTRKNITATITRVLTLTRMRCR